MMSMASTSKVKMIFSNYWRYSWEFVLNPKDGEEKCLAEIFSHRLPYPGGKLTPVSF